MDPGAVLVALLGSANLSSRGPVFEQYDSTVQANTVAGPGHGAAVAPDQGHDEGARRHDRREPGGRRARPVAGRGAERRRGDPQRRDHRRPAARRHELPELRRPDPARGVLAAHARASAGSPTRAGRSACRSPAATSRSTTSRPAARSRRPPRSASSACSTTSRRSSGRRLRAAGDGSSSSARRRPAWRAAPTRELAGLAAEDGPPSLDLDRERRIQAFVRDADRRAGCSRRPRTSPAAASPSRSRSAASGRIGTGARRAGPAAGRQLAGGRPVRREPLAPGRLGTPAPRAGARPARPPARPADRGGGRGGAIGAVSPTRTPTLAARLVIELHGAGATGAAEDRGSRVADALVVGLDELRHAWERRPAACARLGGPR